jgi:tripeptidyl-peptidase-1
LNPWLYSNASAGLTDITNRYNEGVGCNGRSIQGFTAVVVSVVLDREVGDRITDILQGWDPVTGLGTPNFESLLKISKAT